MSANSSMALCYNGSAGGGMFYLALAIFLAPLVVIAVLYVIRKRMERATKRRG